MYKYLRIPSFGAVFIGEYFRDNNAIRHEYGHIVQLKEKGPSLYIYNIVIPSVTAYYLEINGKLPYDYYGSPWESDADLRGGVVRYSNNTPWPEGAYNSYFDLIKLFFER